MAAEEIENRVWAAIDRARERPLSIPDVDRLFASLKTEFPEIGIVTDDPAEGERACAGLMLLTLKMLMPECKDIMETFANKQSVKIANETTESGAILLDQQVDEILRPRLFNEQQKRAAELIGLYNEAVARGKDEDEFLVRTGLAMRADIIEALACESDPSHIAHLRLWLDRLEPYWRNQPKMTFAEARALWETDQRRG